ncbi:hypothetical protein NUM3379_40360 [Kineococcus sp. NUM-3379]
MSALVAAIASITALALTPPVWAAFTASVPTASPLTVRGSFPDYPTQVKDKSPQFYHRFDEANATATTVAADATANARHGNHAAAPTGPSIWWKFDENTGTGTADRAGSAKKGFFGGDPAWVAGRTGWGAHLDGDDHVDTPRPGANTNVPFTVSAWVRLDSATSVQTVVSQPGSVTSGYILKWQPLDTTVTPAKGRWEFYLPKTDSASASISIVWGPTIDAPPPTKWTHLVGIYSNQVNPSSTPAVSHPILLYVDGTGYWVPSTDRGTTTLPGNFAGGLNVGRARVNSTYDNYLRGAVDDVRIWRRALGGSEVGTLYNGTAEPPVSAWSFDDGSDFSTGTHDDTGGGNTLTFAANASSRGDVTYGGVATHEYKVGSGAAELNTAGATGTNFGTAARAPLRTDQSFTVMAWAALYPSAVSGGAISHWNAVLSQDTLPGATGTNAWLLEYEKSSNQWSFSMTPPGSSTAAQTYALSGIAPPVPNSTTAPTWYHLVGVYDDVAKVGRIYVNGVWRDDSPTFDYTYNATGPVVVGRTKYNNANTSFFHGLIDDVRLYQRALSASEITNIYNSTNAGNEASWPLAGASEPGALNGVQKAHNPNSAVAFSGTGGGLTNKAGTAFSWDPATTWTTQPPEVTVSAWFRTASPNGGVIAQLANNHTSRPWEYDRTLYLNKNNQLVFYTLNSQTWQGQYVTSPGTYADGGWHHVVAVISSTRGTSLYVDGVEVAYDASYTTAGSGTPQNIWRWGNGNLAYQADRPASYGFTGTLDELAVYHTALTKQEVLWMYHANH